MKATRAAVRQAKSLESQDGRLAQIDQRLERIEALLIELHQQGMVSSDELADVLTDNSPTTQEVHAEAFQAARRPGLKPKGG